jgi:hypothetical protein
MEIKLHRRGVSFVMIHPQKIGDVETRLISGFGVPPHFLRRLAHLESDLSKSSLNTFGEWAIESLAVTSAGGYILNKI